MQRGDASFHAGTIPEAPDAAPPSLLQLNAGPLTDIIRTWSDEDGEHVLNSRCADEACNRQAMHTAVGQRMGVSCGERVWVSPGGSTVNSVMVSWTNARRELALSQQEPWEWTHKGVKHGNVWCATRPEMMCSKLKRSLGDDRQQFLDHTAARNAEHSHRHLAVYGEATATSASCGHSEIVLHQLAQCLRATLTDDQPDAFDRAFASARGSCFDTTQIPSKWLEQIPGSQVRNGHNLALALSSTEDIPRFVAQSRVTCANCFRLPRQQLADSKRQEELQQLYDARKERTGCQGPLLFGAGYRCAWTRGGSERVTVASLEMHHVDQSVLTAGFPYEAGQTRKMIDGCPSELEGLEDQYEDISDEAFTAYLYDANNLSMCNLCHRFAHDHCVQGAKAMAGELQRNERWWHVGTIPYVRN